MDLFRDQATVRLTPCTWIPAFQRRLSPPTNLESPHIETLRQLGVDFDEEEDIIAFLYRYLSETYEESDRTLFQLEEMQAMCPRISLKDLKSRADEAGQRLVALVDERSFAGGPRPHRGPLTARQLFDLLIERANQGEMPETNRRLIYLTDLDHVTVATLIATANRRLFCILRDAIYDHFSRNAYIGVNFPSTHEFAIVFQLPYYSWRCHPYPLEDHRRRADGRLLRQSKDLDFLSPAVKKGDRIHEACISCVITGSGDFSWSAYLFNDIFFDSEDTKQSVTSYDEHPPAFRPDPLTIGQRDAGKPLWNPRENFLAVFETRSLQVEQEWRNVVHRLKSLIYQYTRNHPFPLAWHWSQPEEKGKRDEQLRESHDWTIQTMILLRQVIHAIKETLLVWHLFVAGDIGHFRGKSLADPMLHPAGRSLAAIEKSFNQLRLLQKRLEHLEEHCTDYAKALALYLSLERREVVAPQQRTAEYGRVITVITMFFYPIALAAGVFSMQTTALPFTAPTFANFVTVTFALIVLVWLVMTVLLRFSWSRQTIAAWIEPRVDMAKRASSEHERMCFSLAQLLHPRRQNMDAADDLEGHQCPT